MLNSIYTFGDIFELKTTKGLSYLQYVNEYTDPPNYGQLVRVLDGTYEDRPMDFVSLIKKDELYYTYIPLLLSVKRKEIQKVGHEDIPEKFKKIPIFRMAGISRNRTGIVSEWHIRVDNKQDKIVEMSEKYQNIPTLGTCNIALISQRIEMGWLPKYDENVIGTKAFFEHFYPEIVEFWKSAEIALREGDFKKICQVIGNLSLEILEKFSSREFDEKRLFDNFTHIDFLIRYYAIHERESDKYSDLLSNFRMELKKFFSYYLGFSRKYSGFRKIEATSKLLMLVK